MSVSREELMRRVHATRRWLEKAEESFQDRSPVKGELNLMLAQAEWQKLRRERGSGRIALYGQQSAALVVALLILWWLFGGGASLPETTPAPPAVVPISREVPTSLTLPPGASLQMTPTPSESTPPATAQREVHTAPAGHADLAPSPLSTAELNSVVSDAGKVLRGQA